MWPSFWTPPAQWHAVLRCALLRVVSHCVPCCMRALPCTVLCHGFAMLIHAVHCAVLVLCSVLVLARQVTF